MHFCRDEKLDTNKNNTSRLSVIVKEIQFTNKIKIALVNTIYCVVIHIPVVYTHVVRAIRSGPNTYFL